MTERDDKAPPAAVQPAEPTHYFGLCGHSPAMRRLFTQLERVAPTDSTVLVTGETGSGKELVAQALHARSPRRDKPLVALDCGALSKNLVESELFGHEKGAFTGATTTHEGAFERAHQGTLFLDEVGELPLTLQPKLLRVLESREVRRVGGERSFGVDVRVLAATNRDLAAEMRGGRFRADLYYRLAVAHVHVPALRHRREDVPLLIEHFWSRLPGERPPPPPELVEEWMAHDWPGNVRELANAVARVAILEEPPASAQSDEPSEVMHVHVDVGEPFHQAKRRLLEEFDRRFVTALLRRHGGNVSAAARAAGIDRMSIHKILARLGLENPVRGTFSRRKGFRWSS
ncbi:MAG: sigma-54 interaction domain-containing protein [Myxococcota bacterium]